MKLKEPLDNYVSGGGSDGDGGGGGKRERERESNGMRLTHCQII